MKKIIVCFLTVIFMINIVFTNYITVYGNEDEILSTEVEGNSKEVTNTNEDVLNLSSKSAILIEANSGKVLYEKNPDEQLRPASVTKIMTLLLIYDEIKNGNMGYEDVVTISEHAASMGGSQCFFEQGEQQKVSDMIKCIEIASGNDAAVAMAEHVAGSEPAFVDMMNEKAKSLGMVNTNFVNACGLEAENHYTCARDIGLMSRELITKHPEIFEVSTIWMDHIIHKTKRGESRFDLANTNKFLNEYNGANGLKTGYTSQAKYCMSATATRDDITLIAVIMGADTKEIRNKEVGMLLDYGYSLCEIYTDTEVIPEDLTVNIKYGIKDSVCTKPINEYKITLLDRKPEEIQKDIILYEHLEAPIYEDDIVGVVQYSIDGSVYDEVYIYSSENIEKKTYGYSLRDLCKEIFVIR